MQADRKTDILEAFIGLVRRYGVDKTTVQDVAKETGLSIGMIYSDFKNKEDLIEAYIEMISKKIIAKYQTLSDEDLPPERLLHHFITGMFENTYKMILEDRGFSQFIKGQETVKIFHKNLDKRQQVIEKIHGMAEKIIRRGVEEGIFIIGDIPKAARLFMNAFEIYWQDLFIFSNLPLALQGVEEMYQFLISAFQKKGGI